MAIELTRQQSDAVTLRGGPLLVSAAAGSGKTRVLVERLADAVFTHDRHIDDHLVVTYTRAAAGELRRRIGTALSARKTPAGGGRASKEILRLNRAQIGTIHSFCSALLRRFAVECGIPPGFRQLESAEADALRARALEETLELLYSERLSGSSFDILADTLSDTGRDRALGGVITDLYDSLRALPDPDGWLDSQLDALEAAAKLPPEETMWGRLLLDDAARELGFMYELMTNARRSMEGAVEAAYGAAFDSDLLLLKKLADACAGGWIPASRALESVKFERLGRLSEKPPEAIGFSEVRDRYKKTVRGLAAFITEEGVAEEFGAVLAPARGLADAVRVFTNVYAVLKERAGALDFPDLEHKTRALLLGGGEAADAAAAMFREVLVDEYQDVNQVQEDIIQALTEKSGNAFLVGDVRQSIYGFRQANPEIFLRKYRSWPEIPENHGDPRCITLPHNFRSHPMLLDAVNQVFFKIMSGDGTGLEYGEREALRPPPGAVCRDNTPRAAFYMCARAGEDDDETPDAYRTEAVMAADIVARALGYGEDAPLTVSDGGGTRAATPGDVAVLLRARQEIPQFRRALTERGIPCSTQESKFFEPLELRTALACFQVLDNPRQDVPLLALLRSPLYNCSPDELAAIRACGGGDLYDALLSAEGHPKAVRLLEDMAYLRGLAADGTVTQVYHAMLERPGLMAAFEALPGGAERRRNLLSLVPVISGCDSVSSLCSLLESMERSNQPPPGAVGAAEGVTLCTMHKSKGLEFPIVVVAGLSKHFNFSDSRKPVLFHRSMGFGIKRTDPELRIQYPTVSREAVARRLTRDTVSEEMRLLYVALTRAGDYLFATASSKDWDKAARTQTPVCGGRPHPHQVMSVGCMASWLLLARNSDGGLPGWRMVRWTQSGDTAAAVTQAAAASAESTAFKSSEVRYAHTVAAELPSKMTVTELKGRLTDYELNEQSQPYAQPFYHGEFPKPRFTETTEELSAAQRGTALHAAMQQVDLALCATVEGAADELERLSREGRLTQAQLAVVEPGVIARFVNSPLGRRVAASADVRRELPFSLLTPVRELLPVDSDDKILLQGMIDLLFWEEDGWVLLDFKTGRLGGRDPRAAASVYKLQLDTYANAVTRITGKPVKDKLIYFLNDNVEVGEI